MASSVKDRFVEELILALCPSHIVVHVLYGLRLRSLALPSPL